MIHAILAHVYHLLLRVLGVALWPVWPAIAATFVTCLGGQFAWPKRPNRVAALALVAGWGVLAFSTPLSWPPVPVARLWGAALLLLALVGWEGNWPEPAPPPKRRVGARKVPAGQPYPLLYGLPLSFAGAWWLRGAPFHPWPLLGTIPMAVGLLLWLTLLRICARYASYWSYLAFALSLCAGLHFAQAGPHWVRAAVVLAAACFWMLGEAATPTLVAAMALLTAAILHANNGGRELGIDLACLAPVLAWPAVRALDGWRDKRARRRKSGRGRNPPRKRPSNPPPAPPPPPRE